MDQFEVKDTANISEVIRDAIKKKIAVDCKPKPRLLADPNEIDAYAKKIVLIEPRFVNLTPANVKYCPRLLLLCHDLLPSSK